MNLFGADRAGLTLQLLSPIRDRELAWGKIIGCGLIFARRRSACVSSPRWRSPSSGSPLSGSPWRSAGAPRIFLLSPLASGCPRSSRWRRISSKTGSGGNPHPLPDVRRHVLVRDLRRARGAGCILSSFGRTGRSDRSLVPLMAGWTLVPLAISDSAREPRRAGDRDAAREPGAVGAGKITTVSAHGVTRGGTECTECSLRRNDRRHDCQSLNRLSQRQLRASLRVTPMCTDQRVYPTNLYPIPCIVSTYCGWRGLGSIFWRSHATCTSTVRVEGIEW